MDEYIVSGVSDMGESNAVVVYYIAVTVSEQ